MTLEEMTMTMRPFCFDVDVADRIAQETIIMIEAGQISIADALMTLRWIARLKHTGQYDEVLAMLDVPPMVDDGIPPLHDR
ncbi:hypothetical protein LJC60_05070 [Ruminococcaceae bacterium OttesenSCG-928-D13]|nr:hypothetical protein [Ruminococcaceae bacterium OttesenSCG-928-D13]